MGVAVHHQNRRSSILKRHVHDLVIYNVVAAAIHAAAVGSCLEGL
jgi:hypothetical protein